MAWRDARGLGRGPATAILALAVLALAALLAWSALQPSGSFRILPYLAFRSVLRMAIAFVLSTLFALTYGYVAATNKSAGRVMLPVLDILQSVPILGFFPVAIAFFIAAFHGSIWGLEAASVFLIFTSQNWNMTFGVFEAVSTIPRETLDAAGVMGMRGAKRLFRVILPATVPKLVYNSIVSWAGGWYFVVAAEIISANGTAELPGLGSFIYDAGGNDDLRAVFVGIGLLVLVVLAFEFLLWRPLQVWSERYKFESVPGQHAPRSRALDFYRIVSGRNVSRMTGAYASAHVGDERMRLPPPPERREHPRAARAFRAGVALFFGTLFLLAVGRLALALVDILLHPLPSDARSIPLALLASLLRLSVAYAITVVWTVPVAIFVARHERASRWVVPLTEVLASIPAVALFPLILFLLPLTGGLGAPSVLLVLTGMQWYLLFNLIAGARAVPADLISAAEMSGVKGWLFWKRVMLPAMMPSFITGSITAWGGGWNALIVSEYVLFGSRTYHTFGIGYLIDKATFDDPAAPDYALLLLSVVAMVVFIVLVNRIVWKPLYARAITKYQLEG